MPKLSARQIALRDIQDAIPTQKTFNNLGYMEVWTVGTSRLDTTINRRLNKLIIKGNL